MKTKNALMLLVAAATGLLFTSCEGGDGPAPDPEQGQESSFVISTTSKSMNYFLTTDNLTEGSLTAEGIGKETDPGTYFIYAGDKYLFRLVYNQGGAGVSSSYELNGEGKIVDRDGTYEIKRFTSYGFYDNYLITTSTGALDSKQAEQVSGNGYIPKGFQINNINTDSETIGSNTEELWAEDYLGNGEYVTFAGVLEANGKIYTAPVPMGMSHYGVVVNADKVRYPDLAKTESGGSGSGAFTPGQLVGTQYPDEAWIAVYDGMDFKNPTLLKTDKISYATGRRASQYYPMVLAADNGDVYVFSPSYAKTMADSRQQTTLPAGVVRIKAGAAEFDPDYYCNIEAQSDGCGFMRSWHIGGDTFMLMMYDRPFTEAGYVATRLAIYSGEARKLTYVTGLPAVETIVSFANDPYVEDGKVYMPVMVTEQSPAIYVVDPVTASAVKGVTVSAADVITSVGRLTYQK